LARPFQRQSHHGGLGEENEAFSKRDLSGYEVIYLFCDTVYESLRQRVGMSEAILVSWAILADGSKELAHMSPGNKEFYQDWLEHLRHVTGRGLCTPLTVHLTC